ncbi:MAG: hypothetical protein OHK0046_32110 [Anaerolineae bacterium]
MKRLIFVFVLLVLMAPAALRAQEDDITSVASSVVYIGIVENGALVGNGSGTIVDPTGIIYTNRHVVEDSDALVVYVLEDIRELPEPRYLANVEFVSDEIDFAIIRIDRDLEGNRIDPDTLNLPFVPIRAGDVQIGDHIRVFGYPAIGDGYMVVTSGEIVTIQNGTVRGQRVPVWYRTDTEFSGGNSGGLAINEAGEIVGIPTWVVSEDRTAGKLGGVLPITTVMTITGTGNVVTSPDTDTQPEVASGTLEMTIVNNSGLDLCSVFISPTTATTWGPNLLSGGDTVPRGASRTFTLDPDIYDVLVRDCESEQESDTRNYDLTTEPLTVTLAEDSFVVPEEQLDQLSQSEIAGGVGVDCTLGNNQEANFDNGVEIVIVDMPANVNYTATAIGLNGFDPVLAVLDTETRNGACEDDTDTADSYQANLPTAGQVSAATRNPQVGFTQDSGAALADVSVVVGGYENAAGEFLVVIEGMTVDPADGVGDIYAVRLTQSLMQSGTALNIYMIAYETALDPLLYLGDPETMTPLDLGGGEVVQCDDAGNAARCWGTSEDLGRYNVTVEGGSQLNGGPLDAMLTIPLEGLDVAQDGSLYFNFVFTAAPNGGTGPYAAVFHMGTTN